MPDDNPLPVGFDELLAAEFSYIAQTAMQANEDRARVSSFYLIAVGSLVAAMFGAQYIDPTLLPINSNLMFSGLFTLLTVLGTSTMMQLARLRAAWYESATAMNQLKEYMIRENVTLKQAFRWHAGTLPAKYKRDSISYYQAREVALISGVMCGAAVFFLQRAALSFSYLQLILSAVIGIITFFAQLSLYRRVLQ